MKNLMRKIILTLFTTIFLMLYSKSIFALSNRNNIEANKNVKFMQNGKEIFISEDSIKTEEEKILLAVKRKREAMIEINIKLLEKLVDENIIVRHMSGKKQSRKVWLTELENEEMKYYSYIINNPEIEIQGNNAIVKYNVISDARIYGGRNTWGVRYIMHYTKKDTEWIWTACIKPESVPLN